MKKLFLLFFAVLLACPPEYPLDSLGLPNHQKTNVFNQRTGVFIASVLDLETAFYLAHNRYFQGLLSWPDTTDLNDDYTSGKFPFNDTLNTDGYSWIDFGITEQNMKQAFQFSEPVCPVVEIDVFGGEQFGYTLTLYIKVDGVPYERHTTVTRYKGDNCTEIPGEATDWNEITEFPQ